MTLRERLQKRISDLDRDAEALRSEIRGLVELPGWDTPGRIHEHAKRIEVCTNRIFSALHQRKGYQEALNLFDFHVSKHTQLAEALGI